MDPTPQRALHFDSVGMTFPDGTAALDLVDFVVDRGEFVAVVGPSGCGKSTLLRLASGLLESTRGVVTVDRDRLAYVFQDATLLPWRTVARNVELPTELHGVDRQERRRRVEAAVDLVGLNGFEDHHPGQLSGGMKMRVSLARALTLDPTVWLFDEPFGALDAITRQRLNGEVLDLFMARSFAGLFITHSVPEAVFLSTRVLVMSARPGRIMAEFDVPFGYPRSGDLPFTPEFTALAAAVSAALEMVHE